MFFAIAALLIQPQIVPQPSFSAEKIALIEPANSAIADDATTGQRLLFRSRHFLWMLNAAVTGSDEAPRPLPMRK